MHKTVETYLSKTFCVLIIALFSILGSGFCALAHGQLSAPSKGFVKVRPVKSRIGKPVSVKAFGATGNGVSDDTAAIQTAINYAASTGKSVTFPAGTYLHSGIITANGVSLVGAGPTSVLVATNASAPSVVLTGNAPSIQNLGVSTLNVSGSDPSSQSNAAVLVQNAYLFTLQNVYIYVGAGCNGCYVSQSSAG